MRLKTKIKRLELIPIDQVKGYSFPEHVEDRYDYVALNKPLMLYSESYLTQTKYKHIKEGYENLTGSYIMSWKDNISFRLHMLMRGM